MDTTKSTMAQQIAQAAIAFEQRHTGSHVPKSVTVVLSEGTLVITLHDALSPAERELAKTPAAPLRCRTFTDSCSRARRTRCGRRLTGSPGCKCARRLRKSSRRAAPWCRHLPPATWSRCSCSVVMPRRRPGAGINQQAQRARPEKCGRERSFPRAIVPHPISDPVAI